MVCAVLGGWSFVLLFVLWDQPLIEAQLLPIHWSESVHWAAWEVKVEMNGATVEAEGSCLLLQEKWEVQLQAPPPQEVRESRHCSLVHRNEHAVPSQCSRLRQFQGKTATSPKALWSWPLEENGRHQECGLPETEQPGKKNAEAKKLWYRKVTRPPLQCTLGKHWIWELSI